MGRGCVCSEPWSQVPEYKLKDTGLRQRGGVAFLSVPPDDYPVRWLVRLTLEHGHPVEAPDRRRGLLFTDHGSVRGTGSAFQHGAIHLRYETKEKVGHGAAK